MGGDAWVKYFRQKEEEMYKSRERMSPSHCPTHVFVALFTQVLVQFAMTFSLVLCPQRNASPIGGETDRNI